MKKSLLSIIIGLSVVGAAVAQSRPEVWTLKNCIDFAQQNNTTVRTRAVQVDQNLSLIHISEPTRL